MKNLYLAILGDCNQECAFCVRLGKNKKISFLSFEEIRRILLEKIKEGYKEVTFDGGEPTLRNDLKKILDLAKRLGYKSANILTNGVRLADIEIAKSLLSAATGNFFVFFSISLHSHMEKISEQLVGRKGTFKKTIKGIENLIDKGCRNLSIYHLITSHNYRHLPQFVDYVSKNFPEIKNITFSFIYPAGAALENVYIYPRLSKVEKYFQNALRKCSQKGINFNITTCGSIPLCFLKGYENILIEQQKINQPSNIGVVDSGQDTSYQLATEEFHAKTKIKSSECKKCYYFKKCAGIWRIYAEKYGLSELKPVIRNENKKAEVQKRIKPKHQIYSILTGFSCNNNCIFCSADSRASDRTTGELTLDAERGYRKGHREIEILGGEVSIRKDFYYLLSELKKIGFTRIRISSNGRMFAYLGFAQRAKEMGLDSVNFSLYSHKHALHDDITRVVGSFNQTLAGIKNALEVENLEVGVNTVVLKSNYKELNKIGEFISGLGVKRWHLLELLPDGRASENYQVFAPDYEKLAPQFSKIEKIANNFDQIGFFDFPLCVFCDDLFRNQKLFIFNAKARFEKLFQSYGEDYSIRIDKKQESAKAVFSDKYKIKQDFCQRCVFLCACNGLTRIYYEKNGAGKMERLACQHNFLKSRGNLKNIQQATTR
ncbi:MAG: radical SAM protein [Patescibacteria group bacterium]|nr:radical SAM protein [Patescibacteria group bacterium]